MRPLTKLKLEYIHARVEGLTRCKAYQRASLNKNMDSCNSLGSRLEKHDLRIVPLILEGIDAKKEQIEHDKIKSHNKFIEERDKIILLDDTQRLLQIKADKIAQKARKKYETLDASGYPRRDQCAGTVKGYIPTDCKPIVPRQKRDNFPW